MAKKPIKLPARPDPPEFKPKGIEPQAVVKGQVFIKIVCPYCKSPKVNMKRSLPDRGIRYYECGNCCAFDSNPTPFKIQERTHEQAQEGRQGQGQVEGQVEGQ